jgi:hypothetical protein
LIRKIVIITTTLWAINEILQATEIFHKYKLLVFLVIHCSSLFGAIIFCFLIAYLKLNKTFMIVPIAIEIFHSWLTCNCIDYWDLIFSLIGILTVMAILTLEKNKLISNK